MAEKEDCVRKAFRKGARALEDMLEDIPELAGLAIVFVWPEEFGDKMPPGLYMMRAESKRDPAYLRLPQQIARFLAAATTDVITNQLPEQERRDGTTDGDSVRGNRRVGKDDPGRDVGD